MATRLGLIMGFDAGGGPLGVLAAIGLVLVFALALSWVWTTLGLPLRADLHEQRVRRSEQPRSAVARWLIGLALAIVRSDDGIVVGSAALLTAVFAPLTMRLFRRDR